MGRPKKRTKILLNLSVKCTNFMTTASYSDIQTVKLGNNKLGYEKQIFKS